MEKTEIFKAALKYSDSWGYIQPDKGVSHNGLRFTSRFYINLKRNCGIDNFDKLIFQTLVSSCFVKMGLLERHPELHHNVQQGIDDYIMVTAAAKELDLINEINVPILDYGKKHFYIYQNTDLFNKFPKDLISACFFRFFAFIAHLYFSCNLIPPMFCKWWWIKSVHYTMNRKKILQDNWLFADAMCDTAQGLDPKCDEVIKEFQSIKAIKLPNGLGWLLGEYFQNHEHVNVKYFVD